MSIKDMSLEELETAKQDVKKALRAAEMDAYLASISHDPEKLLQLIDAIEKLRENALEEQRDAEALKALGMKS